MAWHYRVKAPNEKVRDPIQGEFFSTEAIKNPADALVREAIQNALDAALKDGNGLLKDVLKVRFFLASGKHAMPGQQAAAWFDGAWDHFHASGNGLREPPSKSEPCSWLVFEDFGTCGLQGDVAQSEPIDGEKNHFFYFFRAEGKSVEGGKGAGGKGGGSPRRLADILWQFDVTWDLYAMSLKEFWAVLPQEFEKFRPAGLKVSS